MVYYVSIHFELKKNDILLQPVFVFADLAVMYYSFTGNQLAFTDTKGIHKDNNMQW